MLLKMVAEPISENNNAPLLLGNRPNDWHFWIAPIAVNIQLSGWVLFAADDISAINVII